jgi:hypothetical protein
MNCNQQRLTSVSYLCLRLKLVNSLQDLGRNDLRVDEDELKLPLILQAFWIILFEALLYCIRKAHGLHIERGKTVISP